jgi:hypothetical protein
MSLTERLYWIDAEIWAGRYPNAQRVCERFEISHRERGTSTRTGAELKQCEELHSFEAKRNRPFHRLRK